MELNSRRLGAVCDSEATEELTAMDSRLAIYEPISNRKTEAAIGRFAA